MTIHRLLCRMFCIGVPAAIYCAYGWVATHTFYRSVLPLPMSVDSLALAFDSILGRFSVAILVGTLYGRLRDGLWDEPRPTSRLPPPPGVH